MSVKRYDMVLRSRGMESWQDLEVADDGDWVKAANFDAKERQCERLLGRVREARDFLSEHELNVFGAGATLFTKLCAAIKGGKP